jgi:homoserine O-acetyltransferase/O-succinyltransferase
MFVRAIHAAALLVIAAPALAENTNWPNYREGDFIIKDYKFAGGQSLPELKLHYRTLGAAQRNATGEIVNGVLLLQGNTGTGANWLRPTLADELFKEGQPLDLDRYSIIFPTRSAAVARASRPTGSKAISRITATTTWSTAYTGWSPRG